MSRPMNKRRATSICVYALKNGTAKAAARYGVSKQYVSKLFSCHKSTLFFKSELVDDEGNERDYKTLKQIFNNPMKVYDD